MKPLSPVVRETMQETADRLGVPFNEYWPLRTQKCVETLERATIERCADECQRFVDIYNRSGDHDTVHALSLLLAKLRAFPLVSGEIK